MRSLAASIAQALSALSARGRSLSRDEGASAARRGHARSRQGLRSALAPITALGWTVLGAGVVSWAVGARLGWQELGIVAAACLAILLLSALFTIGRSELSVDVRLEPPRVVVGDPAAGQVTIRNVSGRRLLPVPVELPVGSGLARFDVPSLAGGGTHEEVFVVPTSRRAVIEVGPAMSVRGDPLGLVRREVIFSGVTELFVHPRTVTLESLGSGFLRDLEGNQTDAISPSDLAFHSLRGYVAGDDQRHVHWRTTARMPEGNLMVRQFLDTRRSHLVVVLDGALQAYATDDEFELAISAGASLALRAIRDEQDASVVPARPVVVRANGRRILDAFSRAEMSAGSISLTRLAARAVEASPDASIAVLVSGSGCELSEFRRAAARFDPETRVVALIADLESGSSIRRGARLVVLTIGDLGDLASLVRGAVGG